MPAQRRVLIIGGSFAGLCCARDLKDHFLVTIVDAKEYFEYTPGVLRAYVKPKHLDALTFTLSPVIEEKMGCKYIWGEVKSLDGENRTADVKPMFTDKVETYDYDFCIICAGCNFNPGHKWGESLWFATIHEEARNDKATTLWPQFDERFLEGRRRHILDEYNRVNKLNSEKASILVVGAGFIGVEWCTELEHFCPQLTLGIVDMLPNCLGPLPPSAANYCNNYMKKKGIKQHYNTAYSGETPLMGSVPPKEKQNMFYQMINTDESVRAQKEKEGADKWWTGSPDTKPTKEYICMGVKASNYFMPKETLSKSGPMGQAGWILVNQQLGVMTRQGKQWGADKKGYPLVYAVGDCNYGCIPADGYYNYPLRKTDEGDDLKQYEAAIAAGVEEKDLSSPMAQKLIIKPIPKISYPGEEEAIIAVANLKIVDKILYQNKKFNFFDDPYRLYDMHWPWGAGMFATSLGPDDACFVAGANWERATGYKSTWGPGSAVQKEIIEASKVDECAYGFIGRCIWHYVHHTPVHLWGAGPLWGYERFSLPFP
jgi:hypothetical protein